VAGDPPPPEALGRARRHGRRPPGAAAPPRGELWTERTVAWYERANAGSDYAAKVLAALEPLLADCRTALDVGAGFGALARPLARRMAHVTALEPAAAMAAALRRAVAREGHGNVTVLEAAWGAVPLPPHDLVLCAQVGPLLRDAAFLRAARDVARRGVALVQNAPGGDDKFFFAELCPRLCGRAYGSGGEAAALLRTLADLGVAPEVTTIEYRSDQPFESLEEACEFWMTYLGRADAEARAFLRQFLPGRLERREGGWIAPCRRRAQVVQWRVAAP
jgi:SAM-dependent methyltransferase